MEKSLTETCLEIAADPYEALWLAITATRHEVDNRVSTSPRLGRNQRRILEDLERQAEGVRRRTGLSWYSGSTTRSESAVRSRALRTLSRKGFVLLMNADHKAPARGERVRYVSVTDSGRSALFKSVSVSRPG